MRVAVTIMMVFQKGFIRPSSLPDQRGSSITITFGIGTDVYLNVERTKQVSIGPCTLLRHPGICVSKYPGPSRARARSGYWLLDKSGRIFRDDKISSPRLSGACRSLARLAPYSFSRRPRHPPGIRFVGERAGSSLACARASTSLSMSASLAPHKTDSS